jgi:DNA polymerase III subunit delta'
MTFDQILGHTRQKEILQRAIRANRLAHAYLFEGPEGIGKQLVALALTRAIVCTEGTGCGTCVACRKVDHHNHPDLHLLEPDGASIKIEQVRDLQKELSYRPLEAPKKICIVDAADRMNPAAGNALLKTLEEPSGNALIILLSAHPERILPTIRSRSQRLPFQRLSQELIKAVLVQQPGLDDTHAHILASLSEGSFKIALGKDHDLYLEQRKEIIRNISTLSRNNVVPTFELAQRLVDNKDQLPEILEILQIFYRDLLTYKHYADEDLLVNLDLLEEIQAAANRVDLRTLLNNLDSLARTRRLLERNINRQLAVENLLLDLAA